MMSVDRQRGRLLYVWGTPALTCGQSEPVITATPSRKGEENCDSNSREHSLDMERRASVIQGSPACVDINDPV